MALKINADVLAAADELAASYQTNGWVSIPDFLDPAAAQQVLSDIASESGWELATLLEGRPFVAKVEDFAAQNEATRGAFIGQVMTEARNQPFQYFYEYVRLIGADRQPGLGHAALRDLLSSPGLSNFCAVSRLHRTLRVSTPSSPATCPLNFLCSTMTPATTPWVTGEQPMCLD